MPSDIIIMMTVGVNLAHNDAGLAAAVPFIAATALVAALPVLAYLLFRRHAQRLMPRVRDWMNANSWLVNIIAYVVFIALIPKRQADHAYTPCARSSTLSST
jgi:uncharacterized protein involved in cysteine biosynthesis